MKLDNLRRKEDPLGATVEGSKELDSTNQRIGAEGCNAGHWHWQQLLLIH